MFVIYKDGKYKWMPLEEYEAKFGHVVTPPFRTKVERDRFRALQFLSHLPFWRFLSETTQNEIFAVVDANLVTKNGWFN
jgi:hypothetical protein